MIAGIYFRLRLRLEPARGERLVPSPLLLLPLAPAVLPDSLRADARALSGSSTLDMASSRIERLRPFRPFAGRT